MNCDCHKGENGGNRCKALHRRLLILVGRLLDTPHRSRQAGNYPANSRAAVSARVVFSAWAQVPILLFPDSARIASPHMPRFEHPNIQRMPAATVCNDGHPRSPPPFLGESGTELVHKQREEVSPDAQQYQQEEAVLDGNRGDLRLLTCLVHGGNRHRD